MGKAGVMELVKPLGGFLERYPDSFLRPDLNWQFVTESEVSGYTYHRTQHEDNYVRGSVGSMTTTQNFNWADAIVYALSAKGPIARYSLPSRKMKELLEACAITNCQFKSGLGNEQRIMSCFDKLLNKLKPNKIGDIINVGSWIRKLSTETENQFLPVWMRLQFLREHGGLCPGVDDKAKELVQTAFNMPETILKDYYGKAFRPTHDREDNK